MKKTALILASILTGASLYAVEATAPAPAKSSYSITTDFSYASEYVFRGVNVAGHSLQGSINVAVGDFYATLWTNQPVQRNNGPVQNEIDLVVGYSKKINDALSAEVIGNYYFYPEAVRGNGDTDDSFEVGAGLTYKMGLGLTSKLYGYHDPVLQANTVIYSLGYKLNLENIGTEVDIVAYAGTSKGDDWAPNAARVREQYDFYGADVTAYYHLSETAKVRFGVSYALNDKYFYGVKNNETWFNIGLTTGF